MKRKWNWHTVITWSIRVLFVIEFFVPILMWIFRGQNDVRFMNMATSLIGLALTFIPEMVDKLSNRKMHFSSALSLAIVLFIFAAEFLGEIKDFYYRIPWWDTMLHTMSGVILGLIGFMLVFALNESNRTTVHLSPIFICFFAFCFALACGAVWEIFEFGADRLLNMDMQKFRPPAGVTTLYADGWQYDAGLVDTMGDLICDALSALGTCLAGFVALSIRQKKKAKRVAAEEKKEAEPGGI